MSNPIALAAKVLAPTYGNTYQVTLGTSALHYDTPTQWKRKYVRFSATGAIQIHFYSATDASENVVTIVVNQASTPTGTGADDANQISLATHASTGDRICAGDSEAHFFVPDSADHFVMLAESADTEVFMRTA